MLFEEDSGVFRMLHKTTHPLVLLLQQLFFNMQTLVGGGEGGYSPTNCKPYWKL